jgi:phosphoribosylpyrophosphate synthetase
MATPVNLDAAVTLDTTLNNVPGGKKYVVLAAPAADGLAKSLMAAAPDCMKYFPSKWKKFADGTDNITLGGFNPKDEVSGSDVLFILSFDSNDTTMSQLHALTFLTETCFLSSLTILLAFLPTGTMERSLKPGRIATCNTTAKLLSQLPHTGGGRKTRVMVYDVHAPPTQFFFTGSCAATLHTSCPLVATKIRSMSESERIDCIAFPDEGACKRFGRFFKDEFGKDGIELVTCCKKRNVGKEGRVVEIFDGSPEGKNVLIMDDLIQTGGTLYDCAAKLKESGAKSVSGFVVHAVFPDESWRRFLKAGDRGPAFTKFWLTNSNPAVCERIPTDDVFEVLDLAPQVLLDLSCFATGRF